MLTFKVYLVMALCFVTIATVRSEYDREKFKKIVLNDRSNDDAIKLTAQELIERSQFDYEEYSVTADDGYITQLVRLINPLVKREDLKRPPIMLHHGGLIDMSLYLASSSIQHHPEKYPRTEADGPITSSSRSIAFMLANNGYDVWLIGTRGSNRANQRYLTAGPGEKRRTMKDWSYEDKDISEGEFKNEISRLDKNYFQYGLDDIAVNELKHQIDKVREITGSEEFSMFTYSLSTPTTAAFLSKHPDYAKNVRAYIQMGPAIFPTHITAFTKAYFDVICPKLPTRGIGLLPFYSANKILKKVIVEVSRSMDIRYSWVRKFLTTVFGESAKYNTNLELNILARIWQPVSFKSVQQYCQNSNSRTFNKFDYGKKKNLEIYGDIKPPKIDISNLQVQHYAIVSGTNDNLASVIAVDRIRREVNREVEMIVAPGYNHMDLVAGVENDKYVNFPVLEFLDKYSDI